MLNSPLHTKITPPPVRAQAVSRDRLHKHLDAAYRNGVPVLLVSAKAGSGKTSLISQWLLASEKRAAWLSLDSEDSDPGRFVGYVLAALHSAGMVDDLESPPNLDASTPFDPRTMASMILEHCFESNTSPLLILDDYHVIEDESVHALIEGFVEGLGQAGRLVLISRTDPPLPLARWRGRGQMAEIRDADLRFRRDEAEEFLREVMNLELTSSQLSLLTERTEGWIVGLQLAGITLRSQPRPEVPEDFIQNFGGTNRYILDYLLEEVLERQPRHIRDFLLKTAILDRFSADVCDAVSRSPEEVLSKVDRDQTPIPAGTRDSKQILRQLEEANMFLIPLDDERRWFRYHHLFSDLLRSELQQRSTQEEIRTLHKRAGEWFRENELTEEAMSHAMAAGEYETAATIIEENIVSLLSQSTMPRLLRWIRALPEGIVQARPWIAVHLANTLAFAGQVTEIERILATVDGLATDDPEFRGLFGFAAAIRAFTANLEGNSDRAFEMAAHSEEFLGDDHLNARAMASYAAADTHFALDDMTQAEEKYREMLRLGERSGQLLMTVTALCELASVKKVQGRLHAAQDLYSEAWDQLVEFNGLGTRLRCHVEFGMADLLYEWNQLDEAYEHAMKGMDIRARLGGYYVTGDIPLMRIHQARGESGEALDVLRAVEQVVGSSHVQLSGAHALRAASVHQYVAVGDLDRARRHADQCRGNTDLEALARARLLLALGQFSEALNLSDRQLREIREGMRTARAIKMLCLKALAYEGLSRHEEAETTTLEAVTLGRPEGFVRTFLDAGPQLAAIIHRTLEPHQPGDPGASPMDLLLKEYAGTLLSAYATDRESAKTTLAEIGMRSQDPRYVDPLTQRELEVLSLIAEGLSNKEMASQLVVAPSTIKQHLKNIYAKLDVHNRTEAVSRARDLHLIS
jgi:LuxR family maltose regulon positive regulatory protein